MPDKLPENYFEQFPERMFQRLKELDDQADNQKLLNKIAKSEPYTIPQGYFDQPRKFMPRQRRLIPWFTLSSVAAALLLLVTVFIDQEVPAADQNNDTVLLKIGWNKEEIKEFNQQTETELEAYMEDIIEDLADDEILDILESTI